MNTRRAIYSFVFLVLGFVLFFSTASLAEESTSAKFTFDSTKSSIKVTGTSTVHDWTCSKIKANGFIGVPENVVENGKLKFQNLVSVLSNHPSKSTMTELTVPVKKMHCSEDGMDKKMYKALKAKKHPEIQFKLLSVDIQQDTTDVEQGILGLKTRGTLTVAGKQREITMPVTVRRKGDASMEVSGKQPLKMSDFKIERPSAMWGTIQAYDDITVHFQMLANLSPETPSS